MQQTPFFTALSQQKLRTMTVLFMTACLLTACASNKAATEGQMERFSQFETAELEDPYEGVNRVIFGFNEGVDTLVLRPVASVYDTVVPDSGQNMIRSFLRNLATPVILLNDLLQGSPERAGITIQRFVINSTIGVAGLADVAVNFDLPYHDEDFGQTLAVWNKSDTGGPYIMLPLLGPSTPRDVAGRIVDVLTNPLTWVGGDTAQMTRTGILVVDTVDGRARLLGASDSLKKSSDDYYSALRSVYKQNRDHEIRNGMPNLNIPAPGDDY